MQAPGDRHLMSVAVVCALATTAEILWPHPLAVEKVDTDTTPQSSLPPESTDAAPLAAVSEYHDIAAHPLFTLDRRPYQLPREPERGRAATPPPAPRPEFHLSAVIETPAANIALLKSGHSSSSKLTVGQALDGWTLVEIKPDAVLLRRGDTTITVELQPSRGKGV